MERTIRRGRGSMVVWLADRVLCVVNFWKSDLATLGVHVVLKAIPESCRCNFQLLATCAAMQMVGDVVKRSVFPLSRFRFMDVERREWMLAERREKDG
jgi:hypothetical protein